MQGDPICAISQATISDLIGLSLNFFILPLHSFGKQKKTIGTFMIAYSSIGHHEYMGMS